MNIQLLKETTITGEVWYKVTIDGGLSQIQTKDPKEAEDFFNKVKESLGKAKVEVVKSENIEPAKEFKFENCKNCGSYPMTFDCLGCDGVCGFVAKNETLNPNSI